MMDSDEISYLICFDYKGSEFTPDGVTQYASFEAKVNADGFAGEISFEATGRGIQYFVTQLDAFYASPKTTSPELLAGAGDDVYFALRLFLQDGAGRIGLDCEIKQSSQIAHPNSAHVYGGVELWQVNLLSLFFQRVLTNPEPELFCIPQRS